jgi:hypothetical protein
MWIKTHSVTVNNIEPARIWQIWSDIPNRGKWDLDTEWARINGPFVKGAIFYMKPKGGPKIKMEITECVPNAVFTDCFRIPFARMYGIHQMETSKEGLHLNTSIKVEGLLGWVLRKLVAEKVADEMPAQTEKLIQLARSK